MTIRTDIPEITVDSSGYRQVNFPQGAVRSHRIDVLTSAGAAQTMTGWALAYIWRDRNGASKLSKTTSSGITIGNGSGTDDRATVSIAQADTLTLAPGKYSWALWRTDSTNDDVLAEGTLILAAVAAQP